MASRLLPRREDYRRQFLMLAGIAYAALGVSYVLTPTTTGRQAGFAWLPGRLGVETLGWLWIGVATLVTLASWWKPGSRRVERWCFATLTVPPSAWAGIFLASWLIGTHPIGYASAVSYALIAGTVLLAARWPNPPGAERGTGGGL